MTNGPSNPPPNGVDSGSALVDMDSVSVTPMVPSPAPLSSMTATPDSNVEAGHNDTGNILRHLLYMFKVLHELLLGLNAAISFIDSILQSWFKYSF